MEKILVTTDGSDTANKALLEAKRLGTAFGAEICILTVTPDVLMTPYVTMTNYNMETIKNLRESGEKILDEAIKLFDDYKGQVKVKLRTGNAGEEIIKEVENHNYDLVVMGSRGLGTFSRAMLGSVSSRVLHHVKSNILIVK